MAPTDRRGREHDDSAHYAGMTGVNLPALAFHGSRDEQRRLIEAVRTHFGPCACVVHHDIFGSPCPGHPCAGHEFLCETDDPGRTLEWTVPEICGATHFTTGSLRERVTRLDRLMFARMRKWRWVLEELGTPRASWPPSKKLNDPENYPESPRTRNPEDFNF